MNKLGSQLLSDVSCRMPKLSMKKKTIRKWFDANKCSPKLTCDQFRGRQRIHFQSVFPRWSYSWMWWCTCQRPVPNRQPGCSPYLSCSPHTNPNRSIWPHDRNVRCHRRRLDWIFAATDKNYSKIRQYRWSVAILLDLCAEFPDVWAWNWCDSPTMDDDTAIVPVMRKKNSSEHWHVCVKSKNQTYTTRRRAHTPLIIASTNRIRFPSVFFGKFFAICLKRSLSTNIAVSTYNICGILRLKFDPPMMRRRVRWPWLLTASLFDSFGSNSLSSGSNNTSPSPLSPFVTSLLNISAKTCALSDSYAICDAEPKRLGNGWMIRFRDLWCRMPRWKCQKDPWMDELGCLRAQIATHTILPSHKSMAEFSFR